VTSLEKLSHLLEREKSNFIRVEVTNIQPFVDWKIKINDMNKILSNYCNSMAEAITDIKT
jgi:hypothetical protein